MADEPRYPTYGDYVELRQAGKTKEEAVDILAQRLADRIDADALEYAYGDLVRTRPSEAPPDDRG